MFNQLFIVVLRFKLMTLLNKNIKCNYTVVKIYGRIPLFVSKINPTS